MHRTVCVYPPYPPLPAAGWAIGSRPNELCCLANIRAANSGPSCYTDLVIALDKSFSMHENDQLPIAKRAIEVVINQLAGPWDSMGLITFDHHVETVFR